MLDFLAKLASFMPSNLCVMLIFDEPECPKSLIK